MYRRTVCLDLILYAVLVLTEPVEGLVQIVFAEIIEFPGAHGRVFIGKRTAFSRDPWSINRAMTIQRQSRPFRDFAEALPLAVPG